MLSLDEKPSFCSFEPYTVRFEPIAVLVVHTKTNKMTHFYMNGPMDKNSVKNCATVAYMRQKLVNITYRDGSQLALQANGWTPYASAVRTFRLSNHKYYACFRTTEDKHR